MKLKASHTSHLLNLKSVSLSLIFIIGFSGLCFCQTGIQEINYELIPYSTVKEYIHDRTDRNNFQLTDLKASWKEETNESEYNEQQKTYLIKDDLPTVWDKYKSTSPSVSWNGKKVMFGFMFSKNDNEPIYCGDDFEEIKKGQLIFLNLKLLKLYNLAMAFEIISVDPENKIIEFSYLEGNISQGKQSLQFIDTPKGYTKIIHSSFFKSESKMRDKFLYPFFHKRTTNEFHRIMKKLINNS